MKLIVKVILLIFVLMTPVIVLYAYSHKQGTEIVEEQITIANRNRLVTFMQQIEGAMEQVSQYSNLLSQDPDFALLAGNVIPRNGYDYAMLLDGLQRKLKLFSVSTAWMNRINLYFPQSGQAVSSYDLMPYDEAYLVQNTKASWNYRTVKVNGLEKRAFTRFFVEPASAVSDIRMASIVVEVDLMADNIVSLLDSFKIKGNNDPFLFKAPGEFLANATGDRNLIGQLMAAGSIGSIDAEKGYSVVSLEGAEYLVYGLPSSKLGWTLVDYVPLERILEPVTVSRNLFYMTAGLLVLMGAAAAYMIYSQVQVPIRTLSAGSAKLEQGELSARITKTGNRDFAELFGRFNRMAEKMQYLIEKVYREQLRSKEAVMKQLQSQINPHFLYNSLAYIASMAQMKRTEPVVSMAYRLADYYRYTTRSDIMDTTVREELAFVTAYIEIMDMQLRKISFQIELPEQLERLEIPKLLIQPIVENAILHGLEPKMGTGCIRISGRVQSDRVTLTVEDDGAGMTDEAIERMNDAIAWPEAPESSFALWNVHQRLRHRFGEDAGLRLERADPGGLRVTLSWRTYQTEGE